MPILEHNQRVSQSLLWQIQRNFFEQEGIGAWSKNIVPHYITSNPFIAARYARLVFAYLHDLQPEQSEPSEPVSIIELGAGSGRFAYHFLKAFAELIQAAKAPPPAFRYVLTDFAPALLAYWEQHPRFQPFVEQGWLDFARFDAADAHTLNLHHSRINLAAEHTNAPVVLLANYFFDSLPFDIFHVENHQLEACLITLSTDQPVPDLHDPAAAKLLHIDYTQQPASPDYYDDDDFNAVLRAFQQQHTSSYFSFPQVALHCLRYFASLTDNLLLVVGDKGMSRVQPESSEGFLNFNRHGSFSVMVNYEAVQLYIQRLGGEALHDEDRQINLNVSAFLLGGHPGDYPHTRQSYRDVIVQFSPDDFFTLKKGFEHVAADLEVSEILAFLRLSHWDSNVLMRAFPMLAQSARSLAPHEREPLQAAVHQVWDRYYPIGESDDLAFQCGVLLYLLADYTGALDFFQNSLESHGASALTLYNMGICHYELKHAEEAARCLKLALDLNPALEAAQQMLLRLQKNR